MNKGFITFVGAIVLIALIAVFLGNSDPITPAIVEARAATSIGVTNMNVLDQGLAFFMKLLTGATVAGIVSAVLWHGNKLYRKWWIGQQTRRWKPGPNANYQQQAPKLPKLTREDIMLMMLGNQGRSSGLRQPRYVPRNDQEVDHEIDIDF
jgi:hypothetical protein